MTVVVSTSPGFGRYGSVPDRLRDMGWEFIRCDEHSQDQHLPRADFLVAGLVPVTAETMDKAPRIKAVLKHGVGIDSIDIHACTQRGIPVTNAPGANSNAVAELAIGMIFALSRNLPALHSGMVSGHWNRLPGSEVASKILGIVGLGNIGKRLAQKALALGMKVVAYDLNPDKEFAIEKGIRLASFVEVLSSSDFVSMHVFGGSGSINLIDAETLARMKPGACILNLSRGDVVDMDAADAALASGHLGGIGLDAWPVEPPDFSHPIFSRPRTILTPHTGADTFEAYEAVGLMNIADICEFIAGGRPQRTVNPEVYAEVAA